MKLHSLAFVTGVCLFSSVVSVHAAQTLYSVDYTPKGGSWSDPSVRLDFGPAIGMATVTFTAINSGFFELVAAPAAYNAAPYSSYNGPTVLSTGDVFAPATEVVFKIRPGGEPGTLSGFTMTVTIDNGVFPSGSFFGLRSLGRNATGGYQTLDLVSGLSAADSVRLPTDDMWGPPADFVETTSGHYEATGTGSNAPGRAFAISGNSFSVNLQGNYVGGGEAFTITVPEPSSFLLLSVVSLAGVCRRRRQ